jgi:hypothetical protein
MCVTFPLKKLVAAVVFQKFHFEKREEQTNLSKTFYCLLLPCFLDVIPIKLISLYKLLLL